MKKIDYFEEWYRVRQSKQLIELRPIRMVLVGLGADARTHRMVEYLAQREVDISLLTFYGYKCGDKTLLARLVEGGVEVRDIGSGRKPSQAELRSMLAERARELGMDSLWREAVAALSNPFDRTATQSGITFSLPGITLPGITPPKKVNVYGSHSVVIDPPDRIRVTFYPAAVHVCRKEFEAKKEEIRFQLEKPPHAPPTEQVKEQWYCRLNRDGWSEHKEALTALVNEVHDAWRESDEVGPKRSGSR